MNDTSGQQSTRPFVRGHEHHGRLDRPSLFANSDADSVPPSSLQGVRILSTLESSRRTTSPPSRRTSRQRGGHHTSRWMQGLLWGLLIIGLGGLVTGFAMVVQSSHPIPLQKVSATPPHEMLPPPSKLPPTAAGGAARIEEATVAPTSAPIASLTAETPQPAASTPGTHAVQSKPMGGTARNKSTADHSATTHSRDQDVALLEAVLAHTGARATQGNHRQGSCKDRNASAPCP